MITPETLDPCPWCAAGGEYVHRSHGGWRHVVRCPNPHCDVKPFVRAFTKAEALLKWATRKVK